MEEVDTYLRIVSADEDDLTDEDKLNDEDTATLLVCDVPGLFKVVNADEKDGSDVPCTSADSNPPAKKQRKERPKVDCKKNSVCSKWSNMDDTEFIKLENLKSYLHDLTPVQNFEKFFSKTFISLL